MKKNTFLIRCVLLLTALLPGVCRGSDVDNVSAASIDAAKQSVSSSNEVRPSVNDATPASSATPGGALSSAVNELNSPEPLPQTAAALPSLASDVKTIGSGDLISVTIREDREGPQTMLVDEQGMISIPYAGPIKAKGKTYAQLAVEIQTELQKNYYDKATVTVAPASQEGTRGRIFVLGQVSTPGPVKIPTDEILTVSRAILQAGVNQNADLTRVSIVRKDPKNPGKDLKMDINVSEVINNGRFDQDVIVRANDMVFVPAKGESVGQVLMSGAIRQPGPMEIPIGGKFMVTDAIFRAGGFADFADKAHVKIIRRDPVDDQKQKTIVVNVEVIMEKGKRNLDQALENEDVVIVPEKWFNF